VKRLAAGVVLAVLSLTACDPIDVGAPPSAPPAKPPPANAAALLNKLVIAEEDTGAHYERDEWGEDWAEHADGCTTRELVLLRQAKNAARGSGCAPDCPDPAKPCWTSPYDGRATPDAGELEIDHRVSVKEASRSRVVTAGKAGPGAARVWRPEQKRAYYEDQANLVAVTAEVNQTKSDLDAGDWKPATSKAWCDFATRYIQTKVKYRLSVDRAEHTGLIHMLGACRK
jgi:hypothetical protein